MTGPRLPSGNAPHLNHFARPDGPAQASEPVGPALHQRVQFVTASDGVQIAWASIGAGAQVLKAPNWMNHIEYQWRSPIERDLYAGSARLCRFTYFDQRGNGLSNWDVGNLSEDAGAADMHRVATAAGLERFAVFGMSQGSAFAVRYAVAHPERVTCLVLLGGFLRGRLEASGAGPGKLHEAGRLMIRDGWGSNHPVFRHFFTTMFVPDAAPGTAGSFGELQRVATSLLRKAA